MSIFGGNQDSEILLQTICALQKLVKRVQLKIHFERTTRQEKLGIAVYGSYWMEYYP